MRSNGLTASAYTPIADLDPRVAASLLDDLARLGVAAYTKPVERSTIVSMEASDLHAGVRDRLYVDAAASPQVRELVAALDQSLVYESDDLAWARLIAEFDRPVDAATAPWPIQEDLDEAPADSQSEPAASASVDEQFPFTGRRHDNDRQGEEPPRYLDNHTHRRRRDDPPPGIVDRPAERLDDDILASSRAPATPEDQFVPAAPPPLPQLAPYKQLAWAGLVGGPALLLLAAILGVSLPTWVTLGAVAGFVAGFITLIVTMEDRSGDDWDAGNGAVV